jgi:hypothetical protein
MSRELILEAMKVKRALYKEQYDLDLLAHDIELEFLFADEDKFYEKQERLLELEATKLQTQLKLKRAHLFGLRYGKNTDPHCVFCFVEHEALTQMVNIEPRILGTRLFKCERCGRELKVEP